MRLRFISYSVSSSIQPERTVTPHATLTFATSSFPENFDYRHFTQEQERTLKRRRLQLRTFRPLQTNPTQHWHTPLWLFLSTGSWYLIEDSERSYSCANWALYIQVFVWCRKSVINKSITRKKTRKSYIQIKLQYLVFAIYTTVWFVDFSVFGAAIFYLFICYLRYWIQHQYNTNTKFIVTVVQTRDKTKRLQVALTFAPITKQWTYNDTRSD